jgi:hypothetical protein
MNTMALLLNTHLLNTVTMKNIWVFSCRHSNVHIYTAQCTWFIALSFSYINNIYLYLLLTSFIMELHFSLHWDCINWQKTKISRRQNTDISRRQNTEINRKCDPNAVANYWTHHIYLLNDTSGWPCQCSLFHTFHLYWCKVCCEWAVASQDQWLLPVCSILFS